MAKAKVGLYIERRTHVRLRRLAKRHRRSMSAELEWLVEEAWDRHMASLRELLQLDGKADPPGERDP